MKKIVVGFILSMLMIGNIFVGATTINNNFSDKMTFEFEDGEICNTLYIGNYEICNTQEGYEVSIENFGHLLVPGKPNLPSKIFSFAIPPGAEFEDIIFQTNNEIIISGQFNVAPCKLPQLIGLENPAIRQKEEQTYQKNYESVYLSNDVYPSSICSFVGKAGYRKYNLIDVRVNPITYKPISEELAYYPEITITISYTFPEEFSSEEIMIDNNYKTEQIAKNIIFNYDDAQKWYPAGNGGRSTYDYVIITLDSLTSSINDLKNWEESKGKNVYVATTSWINSNYNGYDLAEKMRNFLIDKYPTEKWGILDVCLIGHYDDVQIRRAAQSTGYGQPETDFYFAELSLPDSQSWDLDGDHQYGEDTDPIDMYAEVNVGRIPWSDPATVEDICQKSVAYEQNDDDSYKKNILLLGAFFWSDTDNAVLMEYKTNPTIHPWMNDWTNTKMYEDAESSYQCDFDLSYANVQSVWSAGKFAFVDWAGHGSPTGCYEYYPSQPFVDTITCNSLNDNFPAIIFADACSNSDTDELNIGQSMLKKGAVGFLGATKVAYGMHAWDDPMDGSSQSLDYFFTTCCTSGDYTQGHAQQYGLVQMYQNDLWYYLKYETFQWGALWGNPDLTMGLVATGDPPLKPTISGPNHGVYNQTLTFDAVTTEPNGEQIYYLFDWGNDDSSDWIGPFDSGEAVQISYSWPSLGSYNVKAKAKDVNSSISEWSDSHRVDILDNTQPENPRIDGQKSVRVGKSYQYRISAVDIDDQDVCFYIFWGDGETTTWTEYYPSGEEVIFDHTFNKTGNIKIQVQAKDDTGYKSNWTSFEVTIPRNIISKNTILFRLFERFSNLFPLLKYLLNF